LETVEDDDAVENIYQYIRSLQEETAARRRKMKALGALGNAAKKKKAQEREGTLALFGEEALIEASGRSVLRAVTGDGAEAAAVRYVEAAAGGEIVKEVSVAAADGEAATGVCPKDDGEVSEKSESVLAQSEAADVCDGGLFSGGNVAALRYAEAAAGGEIAKEVSVAVADGEAATGVCPKDDGDVCGKSESVIAQSEAADVCDGGLFSGGNAAATGRVLKRKEAKEKEKNVYKYIFPTVVHSVGEGEFLAPSAEEVAQYAKRYHLLLEAGEFVEFYEARGWQVGKTAIKNWRALARLWHRRALAEQKKREARTAAEAAKDAIADKVAIFGGGFGGDGGIGSGEKKFRQSGQVLPRFLAKNGKGREAADGEEEAYWSEAFRRVQAAAAEREVEKEGGKEEPPTVEKGNTSGTNDDEGAAMAESDAASLKGKKESARPWDKEKLAPFTRFMRRIEINDLASEGTNE